MAMTYSKYLKISHETLIAKGVYNAALDQDYELHVDPLLLKTSGLPEFEGTYDKFIGYFNQFVTLAPFVKVRSMSDRFYRQMFSAFQFPERANTGLGYSRRSTHGRGISGDLSIQLTNSAIEIINAGLKDPAVFALLPLFEDNIGADRISDMTISILYEHFLRYTHRIASELCVATYKFKYEKSLYCLPVYKKRPIIFIPMSILTDLPIAREYGEIDCVCNYNSKLKKEIATQIGLSWYQYSKMKKHDWKQLLLKNTQIFIDAIDTYKHLEGVPYDFNEDKKGKYCAARFADLTTEQPLELCQFLTDSPSSILDISRAIINQFKSLVENNHMWKVFNRKGRKPDETDWQLYIYSIADTYIKAANIDIDVSRENNTGVGAIDFKFSKGRQGKTIVEVKRSENVNLLHGYVTQLPEYMHSEAAEFGIFVIIKEDDKDEERIRAVYEASFAMRLKGEYAPEIVLIDARVKSTASKQLVNNV